MKPYDPQSQSLQPLLSTIIRRFPSFQVDLRNSESGEELRKSAWRLERGEKQLHSTPRVPIKYTRTLETWGGEKEPQFGYPTKDHCIGVLQIPAKIVAICLSTEKKIASLTSMDIFSGMRMGSSPELRAFYGKLVLQHSQSANTASRQPEEA
ncbi:uncharacterized protein EAE98_000301 [Botrytis deweyae]|uniref:Uncharacterized protein n=1 Tax=Botrytis deweyae TaxID=2478750 RepID=A0ABQ7J2B9_9HELO|nr:uncharacterized protein EAE98_000301 [Botrytis deweyae]KAF7927911.1 hypothetical protein EAE99_005288 [Botrytis elliptica]KAF7940174.1 hypothetical protein EAE98_000301 [Botrytis deweyae]